MKKILGLLLAFALILGVMPADIFQSAGAATGEVAFDFRLNAYANDASKAETTVENITDYSGDRNWKYLAKNKITTDLVRGEGNAYFATRWNGGGYGWYAYKVKGFQPGTYDVVLDCIKNKNCTVAAMHLMPVSVLDGSGTDVQKISNNYIANTQTAGSAKYLIGTTVLNSATAGGATPTVGQYTFPAGTTADTEFILVIGEAYKVDIEDETTQNNFGNLRSEGIIYQSKVTFVPTWKVLTSIEASIADAEVGETLASPSVIWKNGSEVLDGSKGEVSVAILEDTDGVLQASGNSIKAVKEGTATVQVTGTLDGVSKTDDVVVTVKNAAVSASGISFAVYSSEANSLKVNGVAYTSGTISAASHGSTITVEALPVDGKIFRGWVRGKLSDSVLLSTDSVWRFKAATNIAITAVYTDEPEAGAQYNEYYNWNGEFLGTEPPAKDPTMAGYTFDGWNAPVKEGNITRYVAKFKETNNTYTVSGEGAGNYAYEAEVTCGEAGDNYYWYRDGKLIDFGAIYKFLAWGTTNVTKKATGGHNGAKLILDEDKVGNYVMVEYDAGTAEIIEVGILFSNSGTPTVENCNAKVTSKATSFEHGQFAVENDNNYANVRGYLIYKDGSTYRTLYAD